MTHRGHPDLLPRPLISGKALAGTGRMMIKGKKIMEAQEERRIFERFMARFPVKFQHSREGFGTEVYLRNASAQGLMVTSKQRMFLHDSVSLVVELPNGFGPMKLTGRVVWIKKKTESAWDMGVEFHKTVLMGMQRMFQLVKRRY